LALSAAKSLVCEVTKTHIMYWRIYSASAVY